jgi:hypothetical protein
MKGVPGLMIAVGLGVAGALCNWLYLLQKGEELERLDFICIQEETKINPGDKFVLAHFRRQEIPKNLAGDLHKSAYRWNEVSTLVGEVATKSFTPGEIVLRQYMKTPPELDIKKLLASDERATWIPVDTSKFVTSLVNAGDQVSFIVPRLSGGDTPAGEGPASQGGTQIIGPYRILALGIRMGSRGVLSASGVTASQENVMTIAVKIVDGKLDERAQELNDVLRRTNFQQVQVLLHPRDETSKAKR